MKHWHRIQRDVPRYLANNFFLTVRGGEREGEGCDAFFCPSLAHSRPQSSLDDGAALQRRPCSFLPRLRTVQTEPNATERQEEDGGCVAKGQRLRIVFATYLKLLEAIQRKPANIWVDTNVSDRKYFAKKGIQLSKNGVYLCVRAAE